MKILIGTPINQLKDYALPKWLENVSRLEYPADLLLVDNSPGLDYVAKVKAYCQKYGITNFRIEHFEIKQPHLDSHKLRSLNVEVAQEVIRRDALKQNYDAWFSWECDQIIPPDALNQLVGLMNTGHYLMVVANSWARTIPDEFNTNMGVTLISKQALNQSWFLPNQDGDTSLDLSASYNVDETMFKKRLLQSGGNYVEVYGVIKPIYHLDKS